MGLEFYKFPEGHTKAKGKGTYKTKLPFPIYLPHSSSGSLLHAAFWKRMWAVTQDTKGREQAGLGLLCLLNKAVHGIATVWEGHVAAGQSSHGAEVVGAVAHIQKVIEMQAVLGPLAQVVTEHLVLAHVDGHRRVAVCERATAPAAPVRLARGVAEYAAEQAQVVQQRAECSPC